MDYYYYYQYNKSPYVHWNEHTHDTNGQLICLLHPYLLSPWYSFLRIVFSLPHCMAFLTLTAEMRIGGNPTLAIVVVAVVSSRGHAWMIFPWRQSLRWSCFHIAGVFVSYGGDNFFASCCCTNSNILLLLLLSLTSTMSMSLQHCGAYAAAMRRHDDSSMIFALA